MNRVALFDLPARGKYCLLSLLPPGYLTRVSRTLVSEEGPLEWFLSDRDERLKLINTNSSGSRISVTNWGKAGLGDRLDRRRLIRLLNNRHNPVMIYNDFND